MDARPAISLCRGIAALIALTAWSSPRAIEHGDFRASLRVKPIISNLASPAIAALEDSRQTFDSARSEQIALAQTVLKIGKKFAWNAKAPAHLSLPPTVISQNTKIDHLRELVGQVQEKPTSDVSVTDYAEILVKEELLRRAHQNTTAARVIPSSTGNAIAVIPPAAIAPTSAPARMHAGNSKIKIAVAPKPQPPAQTIASQPRTAENAPPIILAANVRNLQAADPFAPEQFEVTGAVTFEKGAAMLGGKQNLTIQHIVDGQVASAGDINFADASYRITVARLEGEVVAALRDQSGMLMAEGRYDLGGLADSHLNQHRIRGIALSIVPATSRTEAVVVAAGALGEKRKQITNAQVRIEDLERTIAYSRKEHAFVDSTLVAPSTFAVRAEAPGFRPTIGLAQSGERFQLQLLPLKLIEALLSLTLDKYSAREAVEMGIIWGHVTMGGHPIEGAQVGVVGENEKVPTYFTGFLPDKVRHSTSPSGEYAFAHLEAGEKMLRVNLADKIFWPVMLPIENKAVTYADLQIEPRRGITFLSSLAFTASAAAAQVQPLGTAEKMFIPETGAVRIENETIHGTSFFEAFTDGSHETMRSSLRSGQGEVHFQFIKKDWIVKARAKLHLTNDSETGAAIFFINGDDYDVIVGASAGERAQNIVYFDAAGQLTERPSEGGGFAVLNLPAGFHTITIIPEKSKKVVTQIVYADSYAVATENVSLMY